MSFPLSTLPNHKRKTWTISKGTFTHRMTEDYNTCYSHALQTMTLILTVWVKNKTQMNLPWLQPCLKPSVWDLNRMKMIHKACRQAVRKSQGICGLEQIPVWPGRQIGQHRQTRKKRETWELTNCFWSLWKSTTRDWFVWALALGRVKVDPDAMTGGKSRTR